MEGGSQTQLKGDKPESTVGCVLDIEGRGGNGCLFEENGDVAVNACRSKLLDSSVSKENYITRRVHSESQ